MSILILKQHVYTTLLASELRKSVFSNNLSESPEFCLSARTINFYSEYLLLKKTNYTLDVANARRFLSAFLVSI